MADGQHNFKKELMKTYSVIYAVILVLFGWVLFRVVKISTFGGAEYREQAQKVSDSTKVEANRGNILDCNGKLLASTIPSYRLHIDMKMDGFTRDTFRKYVDSMAISLSRIYGTASSQDFRQRLINAYARQDRYFLVDKKWLNYTEYKQVLSAPYFRKGRKSGACWEESIKRELPFGKLAQRTIGTIKDTVGITGLEMAFNNVLAGVPGVGVKEKKGGQWVKVNLVDPIDGKDVVSTIDIDIQDITEDALERYLQKTQSAWGCAVVMEVATGEVKAMANLTLTADSSYSELVRNYALAASTEPGSTFKTASVMVALDDGLTDTSKVIDTEFGYWKKDNWDRFVTDHNVGKNADGTYNEKGGYGKISLAKAMWYSSNIGIAKMVDEYYGKDPQRFVNRLYDMRLKEDLGIVIPGAEKPSFPDPSDKDNWSGLSLSWLSFGYGLKVPPIYTLTFYNGIANNGKMISPVLAKSVVEKDGRVVKSFSTHTVKKRLCNESTLKKVRKMLEGVVNNGTGRIFKSNNVTFAGKTGTAQTNYWTGKIGHQYSFCGYFPADKPQYSCIVVVFEPKEGIYLPIKKFSKEKNDSVNVWAPASPAGLTFREIAEHVSARKVSIVGNALKNRDVKLPSSYKGHAKQTETVFDELDVPFILPKEARNRDWATSNPGKKKVEMATYNESYLTVPNVVGMGAKDAVYIIEQCGMKARVHGYGDVVEQSVPPKSKIVKDAVVDLNMRYK